jgi:hypothetical protein
MCFSEWREHTGGCPRSGTPGFSAIINGDGSTRFRKLPPDTESNHATPDDKNLFICHFFLMAFSLPINVS